MHIMLRYTKWEDWSLTIPIVSKALDTIGNYSNMIVSIETYLILNINGELIVRNSSLCNNVIFHEFDFETSELDFEIKHLMKAHNLVCDKGVFSFIIISQLQRPIKLKCSQVCYFMHIMLRYTKRGDWSLTITNSVQCL